MKCVDCPMLDNKNKICKSEGKGILRKCLNFLVDWNFDRIFPKLESNPKTLEVGCGWNSRYRDLCINTYKSNWFGIDPQERHGKGRSTIRTKSGVVSNIPFPEKYFDFVYANQSMEHWEDFDFEHTIEDGIKEIYRILKYNGYLMINVPIHLHGNPIFINYDWQTIRSLFLDEYWYNIDWQEWRKEYQPLEPCFSWKSSRVKKPYKYSQFLENTSSWILNIVCRKR